MHDLIDKIYKVDARRRFKSIKKVGNICMISSEAPDTNNSNGQPHDYRIRKTVIAKYRSNKPYLGNRGTDRIEEIIDDVLEATSVVFFPNSYLVAIEYSNSGARKKAIEIYLDSFLPSKENDNWTVEFIPVESRLGFSDVQDSQSIRAIEFKLDLTTADRTVFKNNTHFDSITGDLLKDAINSHNDFGANTATIIFGNGHFRKDVIDAKSLIELIAALNWESSIFDSIKVRYVSPTTHDIEKIDLKNDGVLKSILDVDDNASWRLISDQTVEEYYAEAQPGNSAHHNYEKFAIELPELVYNNDIQEE